MSAWNKKQSFKSYFINFVIENMVIIIFYYYTKNIIQCNSLIFYIYFFILCVASYFHLHDMKMCDNPDNSIVITCSNPK